MSDELLLTVHQTFVTVKILVFLSKCHILFDMYCDGLHKMVYKAIAYEK